MPIEDRDYYRERHRSGDSSDPCCGVLGGLAIVAVVLVVAALWAGILPPFW